MCLHVDEWEIGAGVMYRRGICFWSGQDVIFVSYNLFEICLSDVPYVSACEPTSACNWNKRWAEEENLCLFFQNKDLCKVTHSILYSPFCLEGNLHALCLSKMSTVNTVFFSFFFFLPFLHVFLSHFPVGAGCGNVTEASGENLSQNQR